MADRFCTSCGDARDGEARFCGSCGAKFADAAGETADPPVDRVRAAGDRATPLVKEEVVTMSTTNFDKKCEILGNLWTFYKDTDNEDWQEFFNWSDLGCPMAYLQWQGMVTIETESRHLIDDTWEVFCGMIEIDVDGSYDSLKGAFDASSNAPIP